MVSQTCVITTLCFLLCMSALCFSQYDFYLTNGIVPDLLASSPTGIVTVLYTGGVSVNMCYQLDPRKLKDRPTFGWEFQEGVNYTLLMLDLDAPSRGFHLGSLVHMLVVNIPANNVYSPPAETVFDYLGPNPMFGTGIHRYVFLVYEQSAHITALSFDEKIPFFGRFSFSMNDFAKKHRLIGPIAGNCFIAESPGL